MVTSIICKHAVRCASSTTAEKEFLVEFAMTEGLIRLLYKTRRVTQLLQGGIVPHEKLAAEELNASHC